MIDITTKHMRTLFLTLSTVVVTIVAAIMFALYAASATASGPDTERVIVQFTGPTQAADEAFVHGLGGNVIHEYNLVPAMAIEVPTKALPGLAHNPRVVRVAPDVMVQALAYVHDVTDELGNTWSLANVHATSVQAAGDTGTHIKVGIIDSGVNYNHPDLHANYVGGYDFVQNDSDPMDVYGHGTHVAGTVCAEVNGFGAVGVAPSCDLYSLRVLDDSGSGYTSDILAAIQWAVDQGLDVVNLSLGSTRDPGPTTRAVYDAAYNAGLLIIAAAGNSGNKAGKGDNTIYPASYDSVIAVAATDSTDKRAYFSSTGDSVELAAPGYSVFSTWNDSTSHYDPQPECFGDYGCYKLGSGTSMASPQVTGVAALLLAAGVPDANQNGRVNDDVRALLDATAQDLGRAGRDTQYGYGLVNAWAAYDKIVNPPVSSGNQLPVANAGPDQTVEDSDNNGSEMVYLDGSASADADGSIFSYSWSINDRVVATGTQPAVRLDVGTYTITLTVTDDAGGTDTDDVTISVTRPSSGGGSCPPGRAKKGRC